MPANKTCNSIPAGPSALGIGIHFFFSALLLSPLFVFLNLPAIGQSASPHSPEQERKDGEPLAALSPKELYKRLAPSVFVVETLDTSGSVVAKGSAVAIAPGEVVTNKHVIDDGVSWRLKRGSRTWTATITHLDSDHDLCQLKAQGLAAPTVLVRTSASLVVGERVYAIGSPEGLELTMSEGLISGLREFGDMRVIQTSAAISPGSSGGGLFDSQGRLVGITTFYVKEGQNLNFALPGEWVRSLVKSSAAAKSKPGRAAIFESIAWTELGIDALDNQDYDKAIHAFKESIRLTAGVAVAWSNLGVAYMDSNRYEDAIKAYQEAIRLKPGLAGAWSNLGIAYSHSGHEDEAIKALQEAIRLDPSDADSWNQLGISYSQSTRYADAIRAFQEAISQRPRFAKAWYNLGCDYDDLARYDDATEAYREAIRLNPDLAEAWGNLGLAYVNLKHYDNAINALREAIRLKPNGVHAWGNIGLAYMDTNRYDDAIRAFQEAIRLQPEFQEAWFNLGIVYAVQGNRTKVMQVYETLKQINPGLADKFFREIVSP